MKRGKYCTGNEDFNTVLYRYAVLMSALNYSITPDTKPLRELSGKLVQNLRESGYSEVKERLLLLYSFGAISEKVLEYLAFSAEPELESLIEAEQILTEAEMESMNNAPDDAYEDLSEPSINHRLFENALLASANTYNNSLFKKASFEEIYNGAKNYSEHIAVINGRCYPDQSLLIYLADKSGSLVSRDYETGSEETAVNVITSDEYSLSELATVYESYDTAAEEERREYLRLMNEVPAIADIKSVLRILPFFDKLYGKDFIDFCAEENDEPTQVLYEKYLSEKKLHFDFEAYPRKRKICTGIYNHYDYDVNKVAEDKLVSHELKPDERFGKSVDLKIDEVKADDNANDLLRKALDKYKNMAILPDDIIVRTVKDKVEIFMVYNARKNVFTSLDKKDFLDDMFDFNKIWSFIQTVSHKHLVRKTGSNDIVVLLDGGLDYTKEFGLTDRDYEYAKNIMKEQLEKQEAIRMRNSAGLKNLTQLKMDAEATRNKAEADKQQEEENKQQKRDNVKSARGKRGTPGVNG